MLGSHRLGRASTYDVECHLTVRWTSEWTARERRSSPFPSARGLPHRTTVLLDLVLGEIASPGAAEELFDTAAELEDFRQSGAVTLDVVLNEVALVQVVA
jgi:hypothetical protein